MWLSCLFNQRLTTTCKLWISHTKYTKTWLVWSCAHLYFSFNLPSIISCIGKDNAWLLQKTAVQTNIVYIVYYWLGLCRLIWSSDCKQSSQLCWFHAVKSLVFYFISMSLYFKVTKDHFHPSFISWWLESQLGEPHSAFEKPHQSMSSTNS